MQYKYDGLGKRLINMQIINQSHMLYFSSIILVNCCTLTADSHHFNNIFLQVY